MKRLSWLLLILLVTGLYWWYPSFLPGHGATSAGDDGTRSHRTGGKAGRGGEAADIPVRVVTVVQEDVHLTQEAPGTVMASATTWVRTRVDGELLALHFQEGGQVRAGALLAEIDARPYAALLAQARGQLQRNEALLAQARLDAARNHALYKQDAIARQDVENADALVAQYAGQVAADQGQLKAAQLQLEYTRITAPIGGRLGLRQVDVGNQLRSSDSPGIVSITQSQPSQVGFALPADVVLKLRPLLKKGHALAVEAWDRNWQQRLALGTLRTLDNQVDLATNTVHLKAEFANQDEALFPNQFVQVRLYTEQRPAALWLPAHVIQHGAQGPYVQVVQADRSVAVRQLTLGSRAADRQIVLSGVQAGERVVSEGVDKLRQGSRVEVMPEREHQTSSTRP